MKKLRCIDNKSGAENSLIINEIYDIVSETIDSYILNTGIGWSKSRFEEIKEGLLETTYKKKVKAIESTYRITKGNIYWALPYPGKDDCYSIVDIETGADLSGYYKTRFVDMESNPMEYPIKVRYIEETSSSFTKGEVYNVSEYPGNSLLYSVEKKGGWLKSRFELVSNAEKIESKIEAKIEPKVIKVKCIRANDSSGILELGKIYEVEKDIDPDYRLMGALRNNNDESGGWSKSRFEVIIDDKAAPRIKVKCIENTNGLVLSKTYEAEVHPTDPSCYNIFSIETGSKIDSWFKKRFQVIDGKEARKSVRFIENDLKGLIRNKIYEVEEGGGIDSNALYQVYEVGSDKPFEEKFFKSRFSNVLNEQDKVKPVFPFKVRCLDKASSGELVVGHIYEAIRENTSSDYFLKGITQSWTKNQFEIVSSEVKTMPKKLRCINNDGVAEGTLVLNQVYDLIRESNGEYVVDENSGSWMKSRFEIISEEAIPSVPKIKVKCLYSGFERLQVDQVYEVEKIGPTGNYNLVGITSPTSGFWARDRFEVVSGELPTYIESKEELPKKVKCITTSGAGELVYGKEYEVLSRKRDAYILKDCKLSYSIDRFEAVKAEVPVETVKPVVECLDNIYCTTLLSINKLYTIDKENNGNWYVLCDDGISRACGKSRFTEIKNMSTEQLPTIKCIDANGSLVIKADAIYYPYAQDEVEYYVHIDGSNYGFKKARFEVLMAANKKQVKCIDAALSNVLTLNAVYDVIDEFKNNNGETNYTISVDNRSYSYSSARLELIASPAPISAKKKVRCINRGTLGTGYPFIVLNKEYEVEKETSLGYYLVGDKEYFSKELFEEVKIVTEAPLPIGAIPTARIVKCIAPEIDTKNKLYSSDDLTFLIKDKEYEVERVNTDGGLYLKGNTNCWDEKRFEAVSNFTIAKSLGQVKCIDVDKGLNAFTAEEKSFLIRDKVYEIEKETSQGYYLKGSSSYWNKKRFEAVKLQKFKCIEGNGTSLLTGEIYEVLDSNASQLFIKDVPGAWSKDRFVPFVEVLKRVRCIKNGCNITAGQIYEVIAEDTYYTFKDKGNVQYEKSYFESISEKIEVSPILNKKVKCVKELFNNDSLNSPVKINQEYEVLSETESHYTIKDLKPEVWSKSYFKEPAKIIKVKCIGPHFSCPEVKNGEVYEAIDDGQYAYKMLGPKFANSPRWAKDRFERMPSHAKFIGDNNYSSLLNTGDTYPVAYDSGADSFAILIDGQAAWFGSRDKFQFIEQPEVKVEEVKVAEKEEIKEEVKEAEEVPKKKNALEEAIELLQKQLEKLGGETQKALDKIEMKDQAAPSPTPSAKTTSSSKNPAALLLSCIAGGAALSTMTVKKKEVIKKKRKSRAKKVEKGAEE